MATKTYTKVKTFNQDLLAQELAAIANIPEYGLVWAGFDFDPATRNQDPIAEDTREIGRIDSGGGNVVIDTARKGDLRFETRSALAAAVDTAINVALNAHDATQDSTQQAVDRQQAADVDALQVLFDAGIADATVSLAVKVLLGSIR